MLLVRYICLICLSAFSADWNSKPFPDWSDSTVLRLLTDSPWARPRTVKLEWVKRGEESITYKDIPGADPHATQGALGPSTGGSPVGGIGGRVKSKLPDTADVIVRWVSALPMRHAKALYLKREDKLNPRPVSAWIGPPEEDYVLEVFGIPTEVAHKGTESIEAIARQYSVLKTKSGRVIRPNRVDVKLGGETLVILVHFSRNPLITEKDGELEFSADFQIFGVRERFRLGAMMYQGRLEI